MEWGQVRYHFGIASAPDDACIAAQTTTTSNRAARQVGKPFSFPTSDRWHMDDIMYRPQLWIGDLLVVSDRSLVVRDDQR